MDFLLSSASTSLAHILILTYHGVFLVLLHFNEYNFRQRMSTVYKILSLVKTPLSCACSHLSSYHFFLKTMLCNTCHCCLQKKCLPCYHTYFFLPRQNPVYIRNKLWKWSLHCRMSSSISSINFLYICLYVMYRNINVWCLSSTCSRFLLSCYWVFFVILFLYYCRFVTQTSEM